MVEISAQNLVDSGTPCITPGCTGLSNTKRGAYMGLCPDCRTGQSPAQVMNRALGTENPREEFLLRRGRGRPQTPKSSEDTPTREAPGATDPAGQDEGSGSRRPDPSRGQLQRRVRELVPAAGGLETALRRRKLARDDAESALKNFNELLRRVREEAEALLQS